MADGSEQIGQDEIEELLRQAKSGSLPPEPAAPSAAPANADSDPTQDGVDAQSASSPSANDKSGASGGHDDIELLVRHGSLSSCLSAQRVSTPSCHSLRAAGM